MEKRYDEDYVMPVFQMVMVCLLRKSTFSISLGLNKHCYCWETRTILVKRQASFEKSFYSVLETQVLSFSSKNELIGLVIFLCRFLKPIKFVSIYGSIIAIDLKHISEST